MEKESLQSNQRVAVRKGRQRVTQLVMLGMLTIASTGCMTIPTPRDIAASRPSPHVVSARPTSATPPTRQQRAANTGPGFRTRHIPIPGSSPNNSREFPYQEILDENARPPRFIEDNKLASACYATVQLVSAPSGQSQVFDTEAFKALVEFGVQAAQAESVLNFYRLRHDLQSRYITRIANERQSSFMSYSPKVRAQVEAQERSLAQRNRQLEQRGVEPSSLTHAELVARLRVNSELIQNEQSRLYGLTTDYHSQLRQVADLLLANGTRRVNGRSELDGLKNFSIDYDRVIAPCRQRLQYGRTLFVWTEFEDKVTKVAMAAFERNQSAIAASIQSAATRTAMQEALTRLVGSSVFVNLAMSVPSVANASAQQIAKFDVAEAAARRQQAAELAAAAARAVQELRAANQRKEAQNAPPTGPEIAELLTTFLIQNSLESKTLGRIERTGERTFDDFFATGPFQDRKRSSTRVDVHDVRCVASARRQVCSYSEEFSFRRWRFGFIEFFQSPIRGVGKAEFYWTAGGLQSPDLQANAGTFSYSFGSSGGQDQGQSSKDSASDAIGERSRNESEARELRQQEARRAWEQDQESRRQRNRRCGPAPNICN